MNVDGAFQAHHDRFKLSTFIISGLQRVAETLSKVLGLKPQAIRTKRLRRCARGEVGSDNHSATRSNTTKPFQG